MHFYGVDFAAVQPVGIDVPDKGTALGWIITFLSHCGPTDGFEGFRTQTE